MKRKLGIALMACVLCFALTACSAAAIGHNKNGEFNTTAAKLTDKINKKSQDVPDLELPDGTKQEDLETYVMTVSEYFHIGLVSNQKSGKVTKIVFMVNQSAGNYYYQQDIDYFIEYASAAIELVTPKKQLDGVLEELGLAQRLNGETVEQDGVLYEVNNTNESLSLSISVKNDD